MIKIIHTADNHVGCRQYGMPEREEDFYASLREIVRVAKDEIADVVVFAGDLFDSAKPSARAVLEVKTCVEALRLSGREVLGIEGNHDLTQDSYWLRVCGVHPLSDGYVNDVLGLRAIGVNYCRGDELMKRLEEIALACENDGTSWPLVVLHAGVAEMSCPFNAEVSQQQLAPVLKRIGCRYCALGHVHIRCEQSVDGILFVQPGSTECKSVDEPNGKSVSVFEMEENSGSVSSMREAPVRSRKIETFDVKDESGLESLKSAKDGSLVVAYVSGALRDGAARATDVLKGLPVLFRVIPVGDAGQERREYDRGSSMDLLKDAVLAFFDEGSEQYGLVMDIINTGNPRMVVENFMNKDMEEAKC